MTADSSPGPAQPLARPWPLTGRAEELFAVHEALTGAGSAGVVLAGQAGVGKTRLAREAVAAAERGGRTVRWVTASASARNLPLGAFAGVVRRTGGDPLRVMREVMDALVDEPGGSRVIVGVDDAHFLDDHSAFLVSQLVLQDLATVVLTVRSGETTSDAVTGLWKDGLLPRLEVQPLSAEETTTLITSVLGAPVDGHAAHRLWSLTHGNALYLRHLVEGELVAGRWQLLDGVWHWQGDPVVSPGLTELIEAQMGGLTPQIGHVVDLLAVSEPLEVELLARLTDAAALEAAESARLVTVTQRGAVVEARLAHPLYGEVRRAQAGQLRGRRLRGEVAASLAAEGEVRPETTLRRAVLTLESDLPPDAQVLMAGAQAAALFLDVLLAERLTRAAVAAGDCPEIRLAHAYLLSLLGQGVEAEEILAPLSHLSLDLSTAAQVGCIRAANLLWDLGSPAEALAVLDRAEEKIPETGPRDLIAAFRSAFFGYVGRGEEAIAIARQALGNDRLPEQHTMIALWGLVIGLGVQGRTGEASAAAAEGYSLAERSFDAAFLRFGLCDFHLMALGLAGEIQASRALAQRMRLAVAEVPGQPQLLTAAQLGHAALQAGDLVDARRWLGEAHAGFVQVNDSAAWVLHTLVSLTQTHAQLGDFESASSALGHLNGCHRESYAFLEPEVLIARAWVAAAHGSVSEATRLAQEGAEIASRLAQPASEVMALQTMTRLGDPSAASRLANLATVVEGPRACSAAAHAAALAADDGDALLEAAARLEDLGDRLGAGDAASQAAAAYSRAGKRGSSLSAAARAERLAASCGGARTPALREALHPLPLTSREREIVTLAARGLSNRAIADSLVVSVRTVEGHLYRATAKLGGVSRSELSAIVT